VPLTDFQRTLLADLSANRTDDRYLAGGAAMHFAPESARYSDDLDFFHDSEARVASTFAADREQLDAAGSTSCWRSADGMSRGISWTSCTCTRECCVSPGWSGQPGARTRV
jgi:hypothetical protein